MATETRTKPAVGESAGERTRTVTEPRTGHKALRFLKQLFGNALDDNIADLGAMMAYYAVLALFPMLLFIVTLAMLVLDPGTIHQGVAMATATMPGAIRELIANQVDRLTTSAHAGFAVGSALFALWGASRGAASLSNALNSIHNKKETRSWIRRQITAIAVTLGVAIMIVLALGLLVVGPMVGHWMAEHFGLVDAFDVAWTFGRWIGAGLLVMTVWAVVYRFLPDTDAPLRIFTPGAFVGVFSWLAISYLFGLYLGHFNSYATTYGALGGAIIFLTWLWFSNIALLFGAELNDVLADFRTREREAAAKLAEQPPPAPPA